MTDRETDGERRQTFDALLHLHERAVDRFNRRRDLEWKLTISVWGGLLVAANVIKETDPTSALKWLVPIAAALIFLAHAYWERCYVARTAERDRNRGVEIERAILSMLPEGTLTEPRIQFEGLCRLGARQTDHGPYNPWAAH